MSKALNESGRRIGFNMCEWGQENPWVWGDACAQSWRVAGDHTGTWSSTKRIISEVAQIPKRYSGRPYGWNDSERYIQTALDNAMLLVSYIHA